MELKYGTSGFRCNADKLISYSQKIGESLIYLMSLSKDLKGFLSIIVTASHNPEQDNGIKIVNSKGKMINSLQSKYLEFYINTKNKPKLFVNNNNFKIIIGKDTRNSGDKVINFLSQGIKKIGNCNIIEVGYITTPIIHYLSINHQQINNNEVAQKIINDYSQNIKDTQIKHFPYVDCSGGVASKILKKCSNVNFKIICKPQDNILNHGCGSDFLMNSKELPNILKNKDNIYGCSLDGDADRSVFWFKKNNKLYILDGDYQLVLWSLFFKKNNIDVVAITTSYCNNAAINFLHKQKIQTKITATGMKNLIEEADKYPNVVYFENNGHGTANIKREILLKNGQKLLYNNLIGDGIYNIITTFQILEELQMNMEEWFNLYKKFPSCQFKISSDKFPLLKMNALGNRILEPSHIQKKIDIISEKYDGRVFIRPSGTEPIIRFYCESQNNIENMIKDIFRAFKI